MDTIDLGNNESLVCGVFPNQDGTESGIKSNIKTKIISIYIRRSKGSLLNNLLNKPNTSGILITLYCKGIKMLSQTLAVGV